MSNSFYKYGQIITGKALQGKSKLCPVLSRDRNETMYAFNGCEEKRRGFKYVSVMNVIVRNQNLEEGGILKRYFYLESFGISCSDNLNSKFKINRSSLPN